MIAFLKQVKNLPCGKRKLDFVIKFVVIIVVVVVVPDIKQAPANNTRLSTKFWLRRQHAIALLDTNASFRVLSVFLGRKQHEMVCRVTFECCANLANAETKPPHPRQVILLTSNASDKQQQSFSGLSLLKRGPFKMSCRLLLTLPAQCADGMTASDIASQLLSVMATHPYAFFCNIT